MKRYLSMLIVFMLLVTMAATVSAEEIIFNDSLATMDRDTAPDPYYPFVYSEDHNYAWLGEELQTKIDGLVPGYLYLANMETNQVFKLIEEAVLEHECSGEYVYAITASHNIIRVDYSGNGYTVLYESVSENLKALEYEGRMLYFADGDLITKLNTQTGITAVILQMENIVKIFPYKEGHLLLTNDAGQHIEYDITTGAQTMVASEEELDAILYSSIMNLPPPELEMTWMIPEPDTSTQALVETYISLPMSEYPAGSYFTTTGYACNDHDSCKYYACTNQCDGFARYVNEHYYHVSGGAWSNPYSVSGDTAAPLYKYEAFRDLDKLRNFFTHLETGAYVRVSRRSQSEDSYEAGYSAQGSHSFVYISHDANGAVLYEANLDGECGVSYSYRQFDELLSRYPYFFGWVNHDQEGTVVNSSNHFHRIYCSHSGCAAYVIKAHNYTATSSGYECTVCGAVTDLIINPGG